MKVSAINKLDIMVKKCVWSLLFNYLKNHTYIWHNMSFIFIQLLFQTFFTQINIYTIMTVECAEMHTEYVSNEIPNIKFPEILFNHKLIHADGQIDMLNLKVVFFI
jgi:hypothetical protein